MNTMHNPSLITKYPLSTNTSGTVLTEKNRTAKFCAEVFVMPAHFINALNILVKSSSYRSPLWWLCLNNNVELLWYCQKSFFCTLTRAGGVVQCGCSLLTCNGHAMALAPRGPSPWYFMMSSESWMWLRKYDTGITPSSLQMWLYFLSPILSFSISSLSWLIHSERNVSF